MPKYRGVLKWRKTMRRIIIFIMIITVLFVAFGCATTQKLTKEELTVQSIQEISKSKTELYKLSNEWMAKSFKSSKQVIQYQDKDEGIIVGKGFIGITYTLFPMDTWFTMTIEIKDNKARVTFEDIYISQKVNYQTQETPVTNKAQMDKVRPELEKLITDLSDYLQKGSEEW